MPNIRFIPRPAFALVFGAVLLAGASTMAGATKKITVSAEEAESHLVSHQPPRYPPNARHNRLEGDVRLGVEIGTDGGVLELRVISGSDEFNEAARAAVGRWVYRPWTENGVPVEVSTTVDVKFRLADLATPPAAPTGSPK